MKSMKDMTNEELMLESNRLAVEQDRARAVRKMIADELRARSRARPLAPLTRVDAKARAELPTKTIKPLS